MAQLDIDAISYFLPLLSFLIVFIVCFFILKKSKLIENSFIESLVSFAIAVIFVSAQGPRAFIITIIPWFAIVVMAVFLIMAFGGFLGKDAFPAGFGKWFLIIMGIIFVITGFFVFSAYITPYLPGFSNLAGNPGQPAILRMLNWLYSPPIIGGLLLLGVGAIVSWILVKAK